MLLIVLLLPAVLIALFMTFSAAKLTTAKMEVQNAADAAAYSVSVLEARDLNFMAYTNRAMIANDVAIAQIVGLTSWAASLASVPGQLNIISTNCPRAGAVAGPICATFFNGLSIYYGTIGRVILRGLERGGPLVITGLNGINQQVYGRAQRIFHGATVYLVANSLLGGAVQGANPLGGAGAVLQAVESNAPGARLSPWGTVALAAHVLYYAGDFFPGAFGSSGPAPFLKTYDPTSDDDRDGFKNWAAIQRDSRDRFVESRGVKRSDVPQLGSGGTTGASQYQPNRRNPANCSTVLALLGLPAICPGFTDSFTVPLPPPFAITIGYSAGIDFGLEFGFGGNELRWVTNQNGNRFGHEAIDRSAAFFEILLAFNFTLPPLPPIPIPGLGSYGVVCRAIATQIGGFNAYSSVNGRQCTVGQGLREEFMLAYGFAQLTGPNASPTLRRNVITTDIDDKPPTANDFDDDGPGWGDRAAQRRGYPDGATPFFGLPGNLPLYDSNNPGDPSRRGVEPSAPQTTWASRSPFDMRIRRPGQSYIYDGIPSYSDTASPVDPSADKPANGFTAPYFVAAVVKTVNPEHLSGAGEFAEDFGTLGPSRPILDPATTPTPAGPVELVDRSAAGIGAPETANNVVGAIARSEVYFKRPNDLSFFARADGNEEYGTAFNPFWQARLVETTETDRAAALLFQQRIMWDQQLQSIRRDIETIYQTLVGGGGP